MVAESESNPGPHVQIEGAQNTGDRNATKTKRTRWATQKLQGDSGESKRSGILRRLSQRVPGHHQEKSRPTSRQGQSGSVSEESSGPGRRLFFNLSLPNDARDEEGHPIAQYPRNKIRTAKYTALSFIPKNLWFQFQNVANIYFLFIIIIGVSLFEIITW